MTADQTKPGKGFKAGKQCAGGSGLRMGSSGAAADGGALWTLADGNPNPSPVSKLLGRAGTGWVAGLTWRTGCVGRGRPAQWLTALMGALGAGADAC